MNGLLKRGCAALLCALLAGTPALAETDGFFSEAGMFEYLSAPTALEMEDFMVFEFLTESDGALIHEYGVSIVTGEEYTVHYTPDADGNLTSDAGSDGIPTQYIRCSTKPMWRD